MKRFFLFFLLILPLLSFSQSIRLYPVGTDRVIADGATGTTLFIKPSSDISLSSLDPSVVQVVVKGVLYGRYLPSNFLKQDGTPYSTVSVVAAVDAYKNGAIAASTVTPASISAVAQSIYISDKSAQAGLDTIQNQKITQRIMHVQDIASLQTLSGSNGLAVQVRDKVRGGLFVYSTTGTVDNGYTFQSADNKYWVRLVSMSDFQYKWYHTGDGDDTQEWQQAANSAVTYGNKRLADNGFAHTISATILPVSGLYAYGNSSFQAGATKTGTLATSAMYFNISGVNNVTLEGFTIAAPTTPFSGTLTYISSFVHIINSTYTTLSKLNFQLTGQTGTTAAIARGTSAYTKFYDLTIVGVPLAYAESGADYSHVLRCTISNSWQNGMGSTGNNASDPTVGCIVEQCKIYNCQRMGIEDWNNTDGSVIRDNIIVGVGLGDPNGIGISGVGRNSVIERDSISGFTVYGIESCERNMKVINNRVYDATGTATGVICNATGTDNVSYTTQGFEGYGNKIVGAKTGFSSVGVNNLLIKWHENTHLNNTVGSVFCDLTNLTVGKISIDNNTITYSVPSTTVASGSGRKAIQFYSNNSNDANIRVTRNTIHYLPTATGGVANDYALLLGPVNVEYSENIVIGTGVTSNSVAVQGVYSPGPAASLTGLRFEGNKFFGVTVDISSLPSPVWTRNYSDGTVSLPSNALIFGSLASQNSTNVSFTGGSMSGVSATNGTFSGITLSSPTSTGGTFSAPTIASATIGGSTTINTTGPITTIGAVSESQNIITHSSTSTGFATSADQGAIDITNSNNTTSNYSQINFHPGGFSGPVAGIIGIQYIDRTNNYGEFVFGIRGVNGFLQGARLSSIGGFSAYKFSGRGASPTIAAGAGTSPTVLVVRGTQSFHQISITTGTSPTASSTIATITVPTAYANANFAVVATAYNTAAAGVTTSVAWQGATTTTYILTGTLAASTTYVWNITTAEQ